MNTAKNKFTFKIILSYLVLGALSVLVGVFLYSEFKNYTAETTETKGEKKFIETGTLINLVYETDGFSRLALLTENDTDFENYMTKSDSLFKKIEEIKLLTNNKFQVKQLDSVKRLLEEKNQNIEQLRILRLTNKKDTSLDDIMKEVRKLETSLGRNSVESLVNNPSKLSRRERRIYQSYADYLNSRTIVDTSTVRSKTVDSMLSASRYIVAEAKKENSRIRQSLQQKENELIINDLDISNRLRQLIAGFDQEIAKINAAEKRQREASIARTGKILRISGIVGVLVVLLFSYFILSDFFKAEKFKKSLQESKNFAESLLKSREQLISTVSHDLKTPLNTITGYSELFENANLSEKQKYYLQQITSSSHFISHLVDDLLDYSKLEAGKLRLEKVPFSITTLVTQAGLASKDLHSQKPVELDIFISENVKGKIFESDPLRIRQIINNLVGNAFKFTERGAVQIRVTETEKRKNISTIDIQVIDTGIGISEEKQELIFREFTQAEADTAHKFGGSGLGLAISKKLAELLDGTLTVVSVPGQGSNFTLSLPLQNSTRVLQKNKPEAFEALSGLKAIIVDDDEAMRALLQEIFEQMGISSLSYGNFEDLQKRESVHFDFLLTDIQMSNIDGFTVLKKLKTGQTKFYKDQPVIAMTGSREHPREYYIEKGFAEMLPKPFSREDLINALGHIFSGTAHFSEKTKLNDITRKSSSENFDLSLLESFLNTPLAMSEVLSVFNSQTEKDMLELQHVIKTGDVKKIEDITHRMLTMFRQIRAQKCIQILEKMENYHKNGNTVSEFSKDFEDLSQNVQELQHGLENR